MIKKGQFCFLTKNNNSVGFDGKFEFGVVDEIVRHKETGTTYYYVKGEAYRYAKPTSEHVADVIQQAADELANIERRVNASLDFGVGDIIDIVDIVLKK